MNGVESKKPAEEELPEVDEKIVEGLSEEVSQYFV